MVMQQSGRARELGVNEAARMLGLRPRTVLRLIHDGGLPARKDLGRWRILRADVELRGEMGSRGGRPYAPPGAWGLIVIASGGEAPWLDRVTRGRIARRIAATPLWELRRSLVERGRQHRFDAHPDSIARLRDEPVLMRSGLDGATASGVGVITAGEHLEAYIPEHRLADLTRRCHLREVVLTAHGLRAGRARWLGAVHALATAPEARPPGSDAGRPNPPGSARLAWERPLVKSSVRFLRSHGLCRLSCLSKVLQSPGPQGATAVTMERRRPPGVTAQREADGLSFVHESSGPGGLCHVMSTSPDIFVSTSHDILVSIRHQVRFLRSRAHHSLSSPVGMGMLSVGTLLSRPCQVGKIRT
jgi:excisionase family DNA binding protein